MQNSVVKPVLLILLPLVGVLLLGGVPSAHGSTVTFDSAAYTTCDGGYSTCGNDDSLYQLEWSHTMGSGGSPVLIVAVSTYYPIPDSMRVWFTRTSPSCTGPYCSHQLSYMYSLYNSNVGLSVFHTCCGILYPGTGTITVDFLGNPGKAVAGSLSYHNVEWVGPYYANVFGHGQASVTINPTNTNDLVVDFLAMASNVLPSPGAGQTPRWNERVVSLIGAASDKPASSPVTMTWTAGVGGSAASEWVLFGLRLQGQTPTDGGGGGSDTCSITLDSRETTGSTNHLGTISVGGVGYPSLPYTDSWVFPPLPYKLAYYPTTVDYTFLNWEVTGGVSVTDSNLQDTGMSCTGDGTLTAVYRYAPATTPTNGAPVGGFMEPVNNAAVFAPYLVAFWLIAAVAVIVWKKREN